MTPVASEADFLPDLIEFLATSPDPAAMCQFIALRWPGADAIHRAALLEVEQDASVRMTGWFGFDADTLEPFQRTSLWDDLPVSVAIREHGVLTFANTTVLDRDYPQLNGNGLGMRSLLVGPIIAAGQAIGALALIGDDHLSEPENHAEILQSVSLVVGLYLSSRSRGTPMRVPDALAPDAAEREPITEPKALTERQLTVLAHLAQQLTNRQIAVRMGFSESTIRQETMAIYRFLHVSGRHQAVYAARERGLIDATTDHDVVTPALVSSVR